MTFIRLDGKPFTKADKLSLDRANLPPMTLNAQGNGWVQQDGWDNVGGGLKNMAAYLWTNGQYAFQVVGGQASLGTPDKWFWIRLYTTPEGASIFNADTEKAKGRPVKPVSDKKTEV